MAATAPFIFTMALRNAFTSWLGRCWQRRWIRVLAFLFACFIMMLAGGYVWMNARGARAWKATEAALAREGVELDFSRMKIAGIPAEENFCAIPLLYGIGAVIDGDPDKGAPASKRIALQALGPPPPKSGTSWPAVSAVPDNREPLDLKAWAAYLRTIGHAMPVTDPDHPGKEVLAALAYQDAAVGEMATVLARPLARFEPDWTLRLPAQPSDPRFMGHYTAKISLTRGMSLRVAAASQAGDPVQAHTAARIIARITQADAEEPFTMSILVSHTHLTRLTHSVWELCRTHSGTAEDFRKLQQELEKLDIRRSTTTALQQELALAVRSMSQLEADRDITAMLPPDMPPYQRRTIKAVLLSLPKGWFDLNLATLCQMELDYLILPLRDHGWKASLAAQSSLEARLEETHRNSWAYAETFIAQAAMATFTRMSERWVYAQGMMDQAILACALERYRIEHGSYPEHITDAARPGEKPLPIDFISGLPMGYRRTEDGRYVLWGVAFDGIDGGGHRNKGGGTPSNRKPSSAQYLGDWVWDFPK